MTVTTLNPLTCFALVGALACAAVETRSVSVAGASPAEYRFSLAADRTDAEFAFAAATTKETWILVEGLRHGGFVRVRVNGMPATSLELSAAGGLAQGWADSVLIRAPVQRGVNRLQVAELDGAQVVRVPQTRIWFGTASDASGKPRFSLDFRRMDRPFLNQYPAIAYYGPGNPAFLRFTGHFDKYYGEAFVSDITDVTGSSGVDDAALTYMLHYPARGLRMPTRIRLLRSELPGNFSLRVWQRLQAVATPNLDGENLEFLHVVTPDSGGKDWGDGEPDWTWYRALATDNPDLLPDSRTALCRIDDNTDDVYSYRASTSDPAKRMLSGPHHTGGAASMEAVNTIGGWFSRSGTGCVGLVFHRYRATFRDDLRPVFSHCGDGADTHFFVFSGELFGPLGMKRGDEVEIRYSLFFLPAEPEVADIRGLNDMDVRVFGTEPEQKTPILAWVATKEVLGLQREDGSLLLLGLGGGSTPTDFPVGTTLAQSARRICRFSSLDQPALDDLQVTAGTVPVRPGLFTLVDCGAALHPPPPPTRK
jgi:hypothetical protein